MEILYRVPHIIFFNFASILSYWQNLKSPGFYMLEKKSLKYLPITQDRNKNWKKWDAVFKTLNNGETP